MANHPRHEGLRDRWREEPPAGLLPDGTLNVVDGLRGGERLNSKLEWQGAEFLVLAHLLIERIEAYKPYVNHPAYDLVAINPAANKIARISVKSRWATNRAGFFPVGSLDCDFIVHVALNRGERKRRQMISTEVSQPQIYVFPVAVCAAARGTASKINMRKIENFEKYESGWALVRDFLQISA
jgi:hypothetical protein